MYNVYIDGDGGLGNFLYQIAYAFNYTDLPNIYLIQNPVVTTGHPIVLKLEKTKNIKNFQHINYKNTFFKKFNYINIRPGNCQKIIRNYEEEIIDSNKEINNIFIEGFCQNVKLFYHNIYKLVNALDFSNEEIKSYIRKKYGEVNSGICICLRQGYDMPGWLKKIFVDKNYYRKCINEIRKTNKDIKLYIISDVAGAWKNIIGLDKEFPAIEVNEKDIIQFHFALNCSHFIMSQSTFHFWIAYVAEELNKNKKIFYKFWSPSKAGKKRFLKNWIEIK